MSAKNVNVTALVSLARIATNNSGDLLNEHGRGVVVVVNMTVVPGVETVTFTIQGKDEASGTYHTLLASAALDAAGATVLRVYPGLTAAANAVATLIVPRVWRVLATHSASGSFTYSVGASVIL